MRTILFTAVLMLTALSAVAAVPHTGVNAVGAPTENYTIPDPANDPMHDEIKPQVAFSLQGPTVQAKTIPPYFTTDFIGPTAETKLTVVGDGKWNLDVDINSPGYLYIYEYYPPDNNPSGHWLAYKWQLKQGGVWRLGPFSAGDREPEGQHVYRLWFYSNGQWASVEAKHSLIYWTYLKNFPELKINSFSAKPLEIKAGDQVTLSWNVQGARSIEISMAGPVSGASGSTVVTPDKTTDYNLLVTGLDGRQIQSGSVTVTVTPAAAVTPPASPVPPVAPPITKPSALDELGKFLSNPLGLLATLVSLAVLAVLIFLVIRAYSRRKMGEETPEPVEVPFIPVKQPEDISPPTYRQTEEIRAKLTLPGGLEIRLAGSGKSIGRADLGRSLGLDFLALISQEQFQVSYEGGNYFIEDANSTNGTALNGIDIKGKGPFVLKDGDLIEPAGAVQLKFFVTEA